MPFFVYFVGLNVNLNIITPPSQSILQAQVVWDLPTHRIILVSSNEPCLICLFEPDLFEVQTAKGSKLK
jgi:hypothetical protein